MRTPSPHGAVVFCPRELDQAVQTLARRLEGRAVAGCAAEANSWLGLLPERARAWRFRRGGRLARSVKGVARAASCVTRGAGLPAGRGGRGRRAKSARAQSAASAGKRAPGEGRLGYGSLLQRPEAPRVEPARLPAAGSTARSEEGENGSPETHASRAAGAAARPHRFGRAPGPHFLRGCTSGRRGTPSARPTSAVCFVRSPGPRALALSVPRVLS